MKKDALTVLVAVIIGFALGYIYRQMEVQDNAEKVFKQKKDCYEVQDLEIIIFDEVQF